MPKLGLVEVKKNVFDHNFIFKVTQNVFFDNLEYLFSDFGGFKHLKWVKYSQNCHIFGLYEQKTMHFGYIFNGNIGCHSDLKLHIHP